MTEESNTEKILSVVDQAELSGLHAENAAMRAKLGDVEAAYRILADYAAKMENERDRLRVEIKCIVQTASENEIVFRRVQAEATMAKDAANKGEAARLQAGGMEMEIQNLRAELADIKLGPEAASYRRMRDAMAKVAWDREQECRVLRAELAAAREALQEISQRRGEIVRSLNWFGTPYEEGCVIAHGKCADIAIAALAAITRPPAPEEEKE